MPIGRAFTVLNFYDLLANLIPGVAWIIVLMILFPVDWFGLDPRGAPGTFVAAVIVFGFIVGHIIQWLASTLDWRRQKRNYDGKDLFTRTMAAIENEKEETPIGAVTKVETSFWHMAKEEFDLPKDYPKSSKLLILVLSYLETRPATRALRFQAIHSFHRSMWGASILAFVSTLVGTVMTGLGWVSPSWQALLLIFLGSGISIYVFNNRKNKFEKTFLKYVFLDFYQDQKTNAD